MLPFTRAQFLAVFVAFNESVWPVQVLAYLPGLLMAMLIVRPPRRTVARRWRPDWLPCGFGQALRTTA